MGDKEGTNKLTYQAEILRDHKYQSIVTPSPLGLVTKEEDLTNGLVWVNNSETLLIDEKYEMFSGKKKICHNLANEITLTFTNRNNTNLLVRLRAYNDGIAFRYELPGDGEKTIEKEETGFSISKDARAWIPSYDTASSTAPAYETLYTNGSKAGENALKSQGWSFPALFNSNGSWILISEAGIYGNYCGSHLEQKVKNGTYKIRFPETDERYGEGESRPSSALPWEMPWRFIIIGNDLNAIVQSNLVHHLSKPCKTEDTDWIKPGRASWSWWSSTTPGRKFDTLKQYVDLAYEMNWEYTLVDAHWEAMTGGTIEELIEYSNNKNVGVWLWYNSGGRKEADFSRNTYIMEDSELRRKEMKRIHELGVKGVKVDFFNSDKQHVMKQYQDILEDATQYQLMVNFHGCTMPRGWTRTYPNLLSMEAIKGGECYRYEKDFPENAPWHGTIAFFVRNTVGPMDYTPVMFSNNKYPHKTTYAHELATAVLFESGIVHFADKADSYRNTDNEVKEVLSSVPASWEETRLVDGYPGKFAVVARKSGNNVWYIAGINGENAEKQITVNLDFLDEEKEYTMKMLIDNDPISIKTELLVIRKDTSAKVNMLPYGGFICIINQV